MAYTSFTIENLSTTTPADITSIIYTDDSNILHHSDFSNFGGDFTGDTNNTGNSTIKTFNKTYVTGSPLLKEFLNYSFPVDAIIAGRTGTTLILASPGVIDPYPAVGWIADSDDNTYDGLHIVSITSATYIVMSGLPSGSPTIGGSITFSTTTNELILADTNGIGPGWKITSNGYTTTGTVISVINGSTIIVDQLPATTPALGNDMIFTSSTNFLTLNNTNSINVGWIATNNGYNGTQEIISVDDSNTVIMSAPPNGTPSIGGTITFSNEIIPIYTLSPLTSIVFLIDYTNNTANLGTWPSLVTINAKQGGSVVKYINNYVALNATPLPPPTITPIFEGRGGGGGGGWTQEGTASVYGNGAGYAFGGTSVSVGSSIGAASPTGADGGNAGGTGGPGGDTCFLFDAQILMANGSYKNFIDLNVGDLVIGAFGEINPILGLYNHILTNQMYTFNGEHNSTADEVFVSPNREFYCMDVETTESYWTMPKEIIVADGSRETWVCVGLLKRKIQPATLGIEIKTPTGSKTLNTIEPMELPAGTRVYNCVVGGSNTFFVNGYAHTAWLREDAFNYDLWEPTGVELTVEDYRNPKMHQLRVGN